MPPLQSFRSSVSPCRTCTNGRVVDMVLVIMLMLALLAPLSTSASASASISASASTATAAREDTFHIDPSDPRFIAVADEIDRRIIESLEKIVEGLQQSRDALRGLQQKASTSSSTSTSSTGSSSSGSTGANAAAALQDPTLQNSIARALDKVETVLHGREVRGEGKEKATVADVAVDGDTAGTYMGAKSKDNDNHVYSNEILAENWVALSFGSSSNSTVTTAAATMSSTS